MKNIIIIIGLIFSIPSFAQVYKFRAFQTKGIDKTVDKNDIDWSETNILVVFNVDKGKVQIFAKNNLFIDLVELKKKYKDDDGNSWLKYQGVDDDGDKCNVFLEVFKDQNLKNIATLFIGYSSITAVYRLRDND